MNDINVIAFPPSNSFTPEQALQSALNFNASDVLVIGYEDGILFVRSSRMSCADALFLLEKAKAWALSGGQT